MIEHFSFKNTVSQQMNAISNTKQNENTSKGIDTFHLDCTILYNNGTSENLETASRWSDQCHLRVIDSENNTILQSPRLWEISLDFFISYLHVNG